MRTVVARTFCAPADSGNRTCGKAFTPNGPQAARSGEHRVVGVGKIFPDNGFDALVRALRLIPAAEFVIIGEAERVATNSRSRHGIETSPGVGIPRNGSSNGAPTA